MRCGGAVADSDVRAPEDEAPNSSWRLVLDLENSGYPVLVDEAIYFVEKVFLSRDENLECFHHTLTPVDLVPWKEGSMTLLADPASLT